LKDVVTTEFNIEGYPDDRYMDLVAKAKPAQATLVPDGPHVITSNAGWDTVQHQSFLVDITRQLKKHGTRVSIFVNPDAKMVEGAAKAGADRVELYTEPYATLYHKDKNAAVKPYIDAAKVAREVKLGLNAGHDLDRHNLAFLRKSIPWLDEVSIGHALIADALYLGLENTIRLYLRELQ
jgi:pyridoxine 5-phosphate synthase